MLPPHSVLDTFSKKRKFYTLVVSAVICVLCYCHLWCYDAQCVIVICDVMQVCTCPCLHSKIRLRIWKIMYLWRRAGCECLCVLITRPLCGLAVKAIRGMPPTLFNRPVLFTNRSITRCLEHAGDRQIFDFTVSGAPGSTYPGRRHAAEALNGEAAKRPSN